MYKYAIKHAIKSKEGMVQNNEYILPKNAYNMNNSYTARVEVASRTSNPKPVAV